MTAGLQVYVLQVCLPAERMWKPPIGSLVASGSIVLEAQAGNPPRCTIFLMSK